MRDKLRMLVWVFCVVGITQITIAQTQIYPSIEGRELLDLLVLDYKSTDLMSYAESRDSMYLNVYRDQEGFVECYYTGYKLHLPEGVRPRTHLYMNGVSTGMTAEHIYPQSKGAGEGDARSDMHCLVPAISQANEARSNYPFAEIDDSETDYWYLLEKRVQEMPVENINAYSERLNGGWGNLGQFEPRDAIKGDIARAVFYFYTMYHEEAMEADPDFFDIQKEVLFQWHLDDPVDELEQQRNFLKAQYQHGKINPFIEDCSLVGRAFMEDIHCVEEVADTEDTDSQYFTVYPNPVVDHIYIDYPSSENREMEMRLFNAYGKKVLDSKVGCNTRIDISHLEGGIYFIQIGQSPLVKVVVV